MSNKEYNKNRLDEGVKILRTYDTFSNINFGLMKTQVERADINHNLKVNKMRQEFHIMGKG